jgi:cbb3-type cytochrome oxidase subunit 1
MATQHFWLATIGIVLYTVAMWAAGLMEGLQWRAIGDGGQLANPIFIDIVHRLAPFYWLRLLGGSLYFVGALMAVYNFWKTIRGPESVSTDAPASNPAT